MAANVTTIPGATEKDIYLGNYSYANILAHMDILRFKLETNGSNRIFYKNASGDLFKVAVEAVGAANHPDKRIPYTDALGVYQSSADLTWDAGLIVGTLTASQIVETDAAKKLVSAAKATAYNKDFGTGAGTVAEGNHLHAGVYEPVQTKGNYTVESGPLELSATRQVIGGALTIKHLDTAGNKHVPTGTDDRVPYWSASGILSASPVYTDGTRVGIGGEPDTSATGTLRVQRNNSCLTKSSAHSDTGGVFGGLQAEAYDADFSSNLSNAQLLAYTSAAVGTSFFGLNRAGATFLRFGPNGTHAAIGTMSTNDLIIGTNDTERMRIYADGTGKFTGRLGIGGEPDAGASIPLLVQRNGVSLVRSSAYSDAAAYGGFEANGYDADFSSNRSSVILQAFSSAATGVSRFGLNESGAAFLRFMPNGNHAGIGTTNDTDLVIGTNDTERMRIYADGKSTFKEQLTVNKSLVCNASLVVGAGGETQGTAVSINTTDRFYISVAPTGPDPELFNYQLTGGEDGQIIFVINKGSYQAYLHGADRIFLGDRAIYRRESGTWEKMAAMDA